MNGRVDDKARALLDVNIRKALSSEDVAVTMWIDTAFNGYFVFPDTLIEQIGLEQYAATDAVLADGSQVTLESHVCYVEWFGTMMAAQVIANNGKLPLLGTEMLANRVLTIDYNQSVMTLE